MKLESEDLLIEFLTPEVGPPKEQPVLLKELKFNSQPLRHLSMLWREPIEVIVSGIVIRLPHPADFCLQKLVASNKRQREEKAEKDRVTALEVFDALIEKGELESIHRALDNVTAKERKIVLSELERSDRTHALNA